MVSPICKYEPQLAMLVESPPEGDGWLHEVKFDGYRIGCRIERGALALISRKGNDWARDFPEVRDAAARLRVRSGPHCRCAPRRWRPGPWSSVNFIGQFVA